jgi:chorismate dehydratase
MKEIKAATVSYLNARPFRFGWEHASLMNEVDMISATPAEVAHMLVAEQVDFGLVPVKVIPALKNAEVISDFGIACNGPVSSVIICAEVPLGRIEKLYLDYQSQTSAALTQILLRDYWKTAPEMLPSFPGYEKKISGTTAGLLIGDRALQLRHTFDQVYDLGEAWKNFTGRPFVFACWVANKKLPGDLISRFNEAMAEGVGRLPEVIALSRPLYPGIDVSDYLGSKIQYRLDQEKKSAMEYFLRLSFPKKPVSPAALL